jgi:hypothetical protein
MAFFAQENSTLNSYAIFCIQQCVCRASRAPIDLLRRLVLGGLIGDHFAR